MSENVSLDQLRVRLATVRRCAVRLAVHWHDERWIVAHLDVRAGSEVAMPKRKVIAYPRHVFLLGSSTGPEMATWINDRSGRFEGYDFDFFQVQDAVVASRRRSREIWGLVTLPQPHMHYEVLGDRGNQQLETAGPLSAARPPYFETWRSACLALVFDRWDAETHRVSLPYSVSDLRIALDGPWLENVHLGRSLIQVRVAGRLRSGCRLKITGPTGPISDTALKRNRREVDVPITAYADGKYRAVLQHDAELLDLVDVTVHDGNPLPVQEPGVTFDPPPLADQVLTLINGGEGPNVEFKLTIDKDPKRVDQAVAAFANTTGGTVLIGVSNDRSIHGIAPERVAAMKDDLLGRIRQSVSPFPPIDVHDVEIHGDQIIAILVRSDGQPPFGVGKPPIYYIRRGANNYKATPDEVGDLVRARVPTPTNTLMGNIRRSQW